MSDVTLWIEEQDPEMIVMDGCDEAIVGVGSRCGQPDLVIYDYEKLVACFMAQGMDHEEAVEWIDFNVAGAWVGDRTPMILYRPPPADELEPEVSRNATPCS